MRYLATFFSTQIVSVFMAVSASAAPVSYEFDLRFTSDYVGELIKGWEPADICYYDETCYPTGFRLKTGYFADLDPGETTTATLRFDADGDSARSGSGVIGGWDIFGDLDSAEGIGGSAFRASWLSDIPTGRIDFDLSTRSVTLESEGPGDVSYSGECDPLKSHPELPDGYCGYFGYFADFEIVDFGLSGLDDGADKALTPVPVGPALPYLASSALVFLGLRRRLRK